MNLMGESPDKSTPGSKLEPKFKVGDRVQCIDSKAAGDISGIDVFTGAIYYAVCIDGLKSREREENLVLCSSEETHAETPQPARKLKGEWRFRPTGEKRRPSWGDWVACPESGIFFYNDFEAPKKEYEILELIEQPREVVEMPDELVFVRRDEPPTNMGFVIVNESGGLVDLSHESWAYYILKPGQLPESKPKEGGK